MAAVAVCLVLLFPRRMNAAADEWADQRAGAVVNVLANAAAPALEFDDAENAREVLGAVAGDPAVLRAALRSGEGALLAWLPVSDRAAAEALPPLDARTARIVRRGRELVASIPVVTRSGAHGNLVVAFSLESLTRQRRENWMVVLLMGGVTLIAGAAFGIVTSSFLLRRRRAEAALGRSERNLRGLIEVSPDAMIVHRSGSIVFANPAASQLFGGGADPAGHHLDEIIPGAPLPHAPPAELTVAGPKGPIVADVAPSRSCSTARPPR